MTVATREVLCVKCGQHFISHHTKNPFRYCPSCRNMRYSKKNAQKILRENEIERLFEQQKRLTDHYYNNHNNVLFGDDADSEVMFL